MNKSLKNEKEEFVNKIDYSNFYYSILKQRSDNIENEMKVLSNEVEKLKKKDESVKWKTVTVNSSMNVASEVKRTEDIHNVEKSGKYDMSSCKELIEKCNAKLDDCYDEEDIRIQIQYAAILIKRVDNMRKLDCLKNNSWKMKELALIRMVIKLNMNDSILTNEQIEVLKGAFHSILEDTENNIISLSRSFRKVGLETMPSWE